MKSAWPTRVIEPDHKKAERAIFSEERLCPAFYLKFTSAVRFAS
jgi:hypothetical protein